jgi:hypothetical protein
MAEHLQYHHVEAPKELHPHRLQGAFVNELVAAALTHDKYKHLAPFCDLPRHELYVGKCSPSSL